VINNASQVHAVGKNGFDSSFVYDAAAVLSITHHLVELTKALNWSPDELIAAADQLKIRGVLEILDVLGKLPQRLK
jgi:hypothetical protein